MRISTAADGTRLVTLPLFAVIALVVIAIILGILLWSVKRRRQPRLQLESEGGLRDLLHSIVGLTHGTLVGGNDVRILQNGSFFDELLDDISQARKSVLFETFLAKEGEVTRRVAGALSRKAGEGVPVRLMLDAKGGSRFGKQELKRMREAGVAIATYHPLRFGNLGTLNNRDHRKIVVIDGCIGYVGGHCLVDDWLGDAEDKKHFRDISIRIEGPVVGQLAAAFSENWIEESGDVIAGEEFFPKIEKAGKAEAHTVYTSPQGSPSAVKLLHYLAIHAARERITIQNPYFLPDPDARKALVDAVQRGVEVRIMLPSTDASDMPIVQHASHHRFGMLLKGGVKIYEYEKTLLHQKVFTVDGCWTAVGSTNFDDRSFELNDEISVGILDETIAKEMEEVFEQDLEHAREIKLKEWKRRPLWHKLTDATLFLFNEQL
ncbi:MAG TPA: phospholipase D-like domain-containing protein [Thermoanaerobaculia bacterium]|nr:phospholipase D-like domain-containing protein [Thermoanaerobaculia bacterium]